MTSTTFEDKLRDNATAMALSIMMERIGRLPKESRDDLFELVQSLREVQTDEDKEEICQSMLEIIAQKPIQMVEFELEPKDGTKSIEKWLRFVSSNIRRFRTEAGLTQEQLAEKSGLPQSHISRLEGAKHSPSHLTLQKIAKALQVDVSSLESSAR